MRIISVYASVANPYYKSSTYGQIRENYKQQVKVAKGVTHYANTSVRILRYSPFCVCFMYHHQQTV